MPTFRFHCTGCGRCCYGGPDHYIEASVAEQRRIQQYLNVSMRWFRRRYVIRVDDGIEGLRIEPGGACAFLGSDQRCRIYPVRPAQCRDFPLWPELLLDHKAWVAEAKRCEGIDQGDVIPVARIRAALKRARRANKAE